jgi:3' terminal RNA ribose 2'-O-methyltransferase Hen1
MLLTITLTRPPATDLGYLLHKHPARLQTFNLPFGQARVFYPEAGEDRCTAALLLEVDPVATVRGRREGASGTLDQYVNDRPYAASSFLSVALGQVFGSAMAGRSREREELAQTPLPFEVCLAAVPCRGGDDFLRRLFEPLGYAVSAESRPLDPAFPEWGESRYFIVRLTGTVTLADLLAHLYVLIPVLDDGKHYWVGDDEVEKLLRRGAGWLGTHPERETITLRYLRHQRGLVEEALARLVAEEGDTPGEEAEDEVGDTSGERASLHAQRLAAVLSTLKTMEARSVLDLGCGEGKLLALLLAETQFERITGMDVSYHALTVARRRLRLDRLPERQGERITLIHGALTYRDRRLEGYDAAAVVEVVEHLDPARLAAFERVLFECAHPRTVVLTTPNREYNVRFPSLEAGALRHRDHRFEWTGAEFTAWAEGVAARFGYTVTIAPVGPDDVEVGAPSQMATFARTDRAPSSLPGTDVQS